MGRPPGADAIAALPRASAALAALLLGLLLLASVGGARAETRIALVIGNGQYEAITPLRNAVSDGQLMAESLGQVGFDVTLLTDADQNEMKRAVADFGRRLRSAGPDATGLFYYAGHGVQYANANYLVPVDASIADEADLDLVGVQADWVLRQLFSARNRTNIVILDACRNNPFESATGLREAGLAEMNAPPGTFIAYASAPGSAALDGKGANSPFTGALSRGILEGGEPIEQVFKQVRVAVVDETGGRQTPWDSSSLTDDFYFRATTPVDPADLAAQRLWETVKATGDPVQVILFLRQYPQSSVSAEARQFLEQSIAQELSGPEGEAAAAASPAAPSPDPAAPAPEPTPPAAAIALAPVATAPALSLKPVAPEPPPAALAAPGPEEIALFERARASGQAGDYEAYLAAYPDGVFASLVQAEIEAIRSKPAAAPAAPPVAAAPEPAPAPAPETETAMLSDEPITFDMPLSRGIGEIDGRSIAQIIQGSPQYPPVEGLPDSYWKGVTCSNCHHWTQVALCEQGRTYLSQTGAFALDKRHPLDGFKQVLRDWAESDCQ